MLLQLADFVGEQAPQVRADAGAEVAQDSRAVGGNHANLAIPERDRVGVVQPLVEAVQPDGVARQQEAHDVAPALRVGRAQLGEARAYREDRGARRAGGEQQLAGPKAPAAFHRGGGAGRRRGRVAERTKRAHRACRQAAVADRDWRLRGHDVGSVVMPAIVDELYELALI